MRGVVVAKGLGIVALGLVLLGHSARAVERLKLLPGDGDYSRYYDLDARGRLLEIDYPQRTARVIAEVPVDAFGPTGTPWGRYLPDQEFLYLFHEEVRHGGSQLFTFDVRSGEFKARSLKMDLEGDGKILPVSRRRLLFQRQNDSVASVLDLADDSIKGILGFSLRQDERWRSFSADGRWLYIANGDKDMTLRKIDTESLKVIQERRTSEYVERWSDDVVLRVSGMVGSVAVLGVWKLGAEDCSYVAIDMDIAGEVGVLARSEQIPVFPGRRCVDSPSKSSVVLWRMGTDYGDRSTGEIQRFRFDIANHVFTEIGTTTYNPAKELALRTSDGDIVIRPRWLFDYVSMRSIWRKWGEDFYPETVAAREEMIASYEQELRNSVGKIVTLEDERWPFEVQHLEIASRRE